MTEFRLWLYFWLVAGIPRWRLFIPMHGKPRVSMKRVMCPWEVTTASVLTISSPGNLSIFIILSLKSLACVNYIHISHVFTFTGSLRSLSTCIWPHSATMSGRSSQLSCRTWTSPWRTSPAPSEAWTRESRAVFTHSLCSENNSCLLDHATVPSHVQRHRGSRLQLDPGQRELRADLVPGADHRCCCLYHSSGRNYLLPQLSIKVYLFSGQFCQESV